ncbi:MAG TPA: hypothetical protein VKR79_03305 [Gaiellaceae bacterium]|nr:hypothetical protein [Gaiellaceae bacterium]
MRLRLQWHRLAGPLAAAALFGIARVVPETGFGLWLRLAAATIVILLPGRYLARCLGQRTLAGALAWSVALVGGGLVLTFALQSSIFVALAFVLGAGAVAFAFLLLNRSLPGTPLPGRARFVRGFLAFSGLVIGGAVWAVQGALSGDSFFHLGRIRKLDDLHALSLHAVDEFQHGGLHPGYAFPLWHGWIALVAKVAGVDPTSVATHESSLLVPFALVLAFEMGWAIFRSTGLAFALVLAQFALKALGPGHAGVYVYLWQPGTAATQLLAPAAVALFFLFLRRPSWAVALTLAVDSAALALVHPTYALFLAIPLAAFVVARVLLARGGDLRRGIEALSSFGIPMLLAFAWLKPVVDQTVSLAPTARELARSLRHYHADLVVHSATSYNLAPARIDRTGSLAIAALVLTPLALAGRRSRWAALVLGGTVSVLALELWPFVFPHFANAVSLSQARRAATFVPFAVAFVGGVAVLSRLSRILALALALGFGIWLEIAYAGDFGLRAPRTQPALPVWIGLYGGAAALVLGIALAWWRRDLLLAAGRRRGITVALATFLFVIPIAVSGFSNWTPANTQGTLLTPGLIRFLQHDVQPRSVVFGDMETSYEAIAYAPVYAVAVPPTHVARTRPNQVSSRRHAVIRFMEHPGVGVPHKWGADWLILRRKTEPVSAIRRLGLRPVYEDERFAVFKLPNPALPLPQ